MPKIRDFEQIQTSTNYYNLEVNSKEFEGIIK